jgi:FKBP-type peptidyl-prolyl cis-trans isomerase FkpA
MKRLLVSCILAGFAVVGTACAAEPELKTEDDKTIYALGLFLANRGQLTAFGLTAPELEMLKAGLSDGATGKTPKVDLQTYLPKIQALAQQKMAAAGAVTAAAEKKKGKDYLDKITTAKPGLKKTGTGLVMDITAEGTGKSPVPTDRVKVNYKGTTTDGKVFDSSEKHGGPYETAVSGDIIKCWTEALEFMKPGGKATIYCPSDLAYGDQGRGPDIPPGAMLIFDLELVEIVKPTAAAPEKK